MAVEGPAPEGKTVKVIVQPSEGALQHPVDHIESKVGAEVETPPDRWAGTFQVNPHTVDEGLVERGPPQMGPIGIGLLMPAGHCQVGSQLAQIVQFHAGGGRLEPAKEILRTRSVAFHIVVDTCERTRSHRSEGALSLSRCPTGGGFTG